MEAVKQEGEVGGGVKNPSWMYFKPAWSVSSRSPFWVLAMPGDAPEGGV
jgi:hypothetical protein